MADDDAEDTSSPPSSHPFFVRSGFPFVFLPTTLTTGFTFADDRRHVSTSDDQTTTESKGEREKEKNSEETGVVREEQEGVETNDDNDDDDEQPDHNAENDDTSNEKNDLRISQPKYSQLLKELDFSHTRMVDVTNLLTPENDQRGSYLTPDENEESPKKLAGADKFLSLSSVSSDEGLDAQTSTSNHYQNNGTANNRTKEDDNLTNAVNEIENELNQFAARIHNAAQLSAEKSEHVKNGTPKKPTFDEDDDTSRQATQNYDLHETEREDIQPSSKSSKIPRLITQRSNSVSKEKKPSTPQKDTNVNKQSKPQTPTAKKLEAKKDEEDEKQQLQVFLDWESLIIGSDSAAQPTNEFLSREPVLEPQSTPRKSEQPPSAPSEEKLEPQTNSSPKQRPHHRPEKIVYSTSSSSTGSDSIVEHALQPPKQRQSSPPPPIIPPMTIRQDSQATLIDENLDDLSSQLKQVLLDQDRQTINTSTKDERTTDGLGSMSFPLSTPDILSTDILDNDLSNQATDDFIHRTYNQERTRQTFDMPEQSNPQRRKTHHHHHRHSASRHTQRTGGSSPRKNDDNWLNMLEKLEREHRARLEKQQQRYEDYMHTLEEKMKRRFDDYLTLTNGSQESRLDNHSGHAHRTHPSIPIDSNIGKYKSHTHTSPYRPLAKDLISRYYPADSTLNILTADKQRSTHINNLSKSPSREAIANLRTELSAKHAKHIADLKLHYEYEINEIKSQLNRTRMGHSSSTTRQSIETIERINSENIRLHDEVTELRHSLKMTEDDNALLKRQLEELREQLSNKDQELKKYHRTITDLKQQLTEAENTKERQDEKVRQADRQALLYREENERIKTDLNLTRERLLRLEERYQEQENENETLRRQLFMLENDENRIKARVAEDHKFNSTMAMNLTTSREYGRFVVPTTRYSSPAANTPRDGNIDSARYQPNGNENVFRHSYSPRPITRISDYLNEKPVFPQPYVPPSKSVYSPRKSSPTRRRVDPMPTRNSTDRQSRQDEHLEQKFDQLIKKKRELETRLSRIPIRGLTAADRQLQDVLEREIDRVEQQISSAKLELRKSNILRSY